MQKIKPKSVRFIKLGSKGRWEPDCIEGANPFIRLGFINPHHEECLKRNWAVLRAYWAQKKTKSKATGITNQIKDFYTLGQDTLWITFYRRRLYWCFAYPEVRLLADGTRSRCVVGKWKSKSIMDEELLIENLSGKLTKTKGFRGTICSVEEEEYLIRRINGEIAPEVLNAKQCLSSLEKSLEEMIRSLGWKDFELLCDLIFTRSGWQRVSAVGGTEKSIDLDLFLPVSGKKAFVQIKSQADTKTFKEYCDIFETLDQYHEMFFVVHSPRGDISTWKIPDKAQILTIEKISQLAVAAGLSNWIIQKTL
ncbi:MAG: hypothetical protein M0P16_00450 [Syntrophales bacterium]|jgi:hypothetical protein|nr:hypothetical protein [Syntrophales bacterium]